MPPKHLQERLSTIAKNLANRLDRKLQRWRVQAAGFTKKIFTYFLSTD